MPSAHYPAIPIIAPPTLPSPNPDKGKEEDRKPLIPAKASAGKDGHSGDSATPDSSKLSSSGPAGPSIPAGTASNPPSATTVSDSADQKAARDDDGGDNNGGAKESKKKWFKRLL